MNKCISRIKRGASVYPIIKLNAFFIFLGKIVTCVEKMPCVLYAT